MMTHLLEEEEEESEFSTNPKSHRRWQIIAAAGIYNEFGIECHALFFHWQHSDPIDGVFALINSLLSPSPSSFASHILLHGGPMTYYSQQSILTRLKFSLVYQLTLFRTRRYWQMTIWLRKWNGICLTNGRDFLLERPIYAHRVSQYYYENLSGMCVLWKKIGTWDSFLCSFCNNQNSS